MAQAYSIEMTRLAVTSCLLVALSGLNVGADARSRVSSRAARVISQNGVQLEAPSSWRVVSPAGEASFSDPKTVLVAGSAGVTASLTSSCQIAAYWLPADGAVVVVVRWRSVRSAGGSPPAGRAPLRKLTHVSRPSFECFRGRGAAAQLRLRGHVYQVNVMVGDRALPMQVNQALAVARSFDLARSPSSAVRASGAPRREVLLRTGIGYRLPAGWSSVASRLTGTTDPLERFAVSSFPLTVGPARDCGPDSSVRRAMPPDGIVAIVLEWVGSAPPVRLSDFPPLRRGIPLGHAHVFECYGSAYNVSFRVGSRAFQAFLLVKGRPGERRLVQARQLLASITTHRARRTPAREPSLGSAVCCLGI